MKIKLISIVFIFFVATVSFAQKIPVGFPILNDYLWREQVSGNLESDFSFVYKPILVEKAFPDIKSSFILDSGATDTGIFPQTNQTGKLQLSLLPVQFIGLFNSHHPYNWGHGAILPAKGIQSLVSAGLYLKWGKLNVQLYPQFHYAQNLEFEEYPADAPENYFLYLKRSLNGIDQPVRFGKKSIVRFLPGNSNISLNLGGIALGISTENLWIGPGQKNSLLMTDNAEGFLHFKLNTTKPLKTFAGNFEGVYWVGKLNGSELPHFSDGTYSELLSDKKDDWRYFTGLSISYNPIILKNLYIGATRAFQVYRSDMKNNFRAYFPLFAPLPKDGEGIIENVELKEDQNVGIFARYLIREAKFDFYFEYSRNDHPLNWRDLILNIEHNRGYLIGFNKFFKLDDGYTYGISAEMTQTQFSINNILRWGEGVPYKGLGLYDNYQVRHGFTYKGENLGAGTGVSGNEYSLKIGRYNYLEEISIEFERLQRDPNYYYFAKSSGADVKKWIDLNFTIKYANSFDRLLISSSITSMLVNNYNHWNSSDQVSFSGNTDKNFNLNMEFNIAYIINN